MPRASALIDRRLNKPMMAPELLGNLRWTNFTICIISPLSFYLVRLQMTRFETCLWVNPGAQKAVGTHPANYLIRERVIRVRFCLCAGQLQSLGHLKVHV